MSPLINTPGGLGARAVQDQLQQQRNDGSAFQVFGEFAD
jgi:hypothetical protein